MEDAEQRHAWIIKRHLNTEALTEYVARHGITRAQVVAITEHQDGVFTLIFEPTDQQQGLLEADVGQASETLDTLFGTPVTPVQTPSGAEVETVVAVPARPSTAPSVAPAADPRPS
jgi:hypothetical protein